MKKSSPSENNDLSRSKASGQWIESIGFRLPMIEISFEISLDKFGGLETVMRFTRC